MTTIPALLFQLECENIHPNERTDWKYDFFITFSPLFKGLVWFSRNDRGSKDRWCQRTLGMDGVIGDGV